MKEGDVVRSAKSPGNLRWPDASDFEKCPEVRRAVPESEIPPTELYPELPPLCWGRSRSSSALVPVELLAIVAAVSAPLFPL